MSAAMLQAILAISDDGFIGTENHRALPWHLPPDLKRFKALTTGHSVIMGRTTFESIGKPLPNRRNIIVTRNPHYAAARSVSGDITFVHSPADAVKVAREIDSEPFVIGGALIYRALWPQIQRVYVTQVHEWELKGVHFDLDYASFDTIAHEGILQHEDTHYSFVTLQRKVKPRG